MNLETAKATASSPLAQELLQLLTSHSWAPGNKLSSLSGQKPGCASMGSTLDLRGRTPGSWDLQPKPHLVTGKAQRISHSCSPE